MVVTKNVDRRWFRRYRSFFIIGIFILGFQIYLVVKFLSIHNDTSDNKWNPHKIIIESNDFDNSANSARRARDGFMVDDEDSLNSNLYNYKKTKHKQDTDLNKIQQKPKQNLTLLRLEELDFVPGCDINTKEAVSAIHRAKTQKCKQELVNITCIAQQGLLYPKILPNYCPNGNYIAAKSLGCFKDEKTFRLLSGYYANFKTTNSPLHCIRMCLQSGFPFAGVQYSTECFCGNDEPPSEARLPDSSCNMKCPADPHLACGGYFTINIYQTGIAKFTPQVAQISENADVKPVRIVFLLTLNGRAVRQVRRLIKILFHKKHFFYIHVDARQDYLFRELLPLEKQFSNIRLARRRFSTIWGGASLLQMLLTSMQDLLVTNWQWDFVINLSESDFPVKTLSQLEEFLSANRDKNFVKSHGREVQRFIQKQGLDKTFVECDAHMWRQGDRQLPWGIQIDGGSDWVALSRPFVSYVASKKPDELIEGLKTVFRYTLLPAESFFHTVLRNSKFCNTYVDNNLHVTNWKRKLGCKCQYKHVVDWCGCSPNDFKPDDWLRIQGTENKHLFFARKFEPIINQAIILQVEEWLHGPSPGDIPNINSYWQSVYHHIDLSPSPDDAFISVCTSLARNTAKMLAQNECVIEPHNLLEISTYHFNDNYEGTLIMYEANLTDNVKITLETLVKPKEYLLLTKTSLLIQRLQTMMVSSDYDQKEQTFRNSARMLGPFSEPILVYQFLPSLANSAKTYNVSFLWIDPTGQIVDISEAAVDEIYVIGHIKPVLKQPLLPGAWIVKLVYNKQIIAQCSFLIVPLEFMSNTPLTQTQVTFVHSGSIITKEFDSHWNAFLSSENERDTFMRKSASNAKRFGLDLREWIDGLVSKFYKSKQTCIVTTSLDNNVSCGNIKLEFCNTTNWSSLAPDPKSQIGNVNQTTGYLNSIW